MPSLIWALRLSKLLSSCSASRSLRAKPKQYFLDKVATGIAELAAGTCLRYEGSYTDYLVARAERRTVAEQQERKRQKFLDRELAWIRRGPSALGPQTKINHVDQNRLIISEEKTVSEEVGGGSEIVRLGDQSISLRAYLRRFLFPEAQASLYQLRIGGNACRKRPVASGTLHLGTQP